MNQRRPIAGSPRSTCSAFAALAGDDQRPARVALPHPDRCEVIDRTGRCFAPMPASLRTDEAVPVVGDWVALGPNGAVERLLPRPTALARRSAGRSSRAQILAANVDVVLVVTARGKDLTDWCVLVERANGMPLLLTPEHPEEFVAELTAKHG